MLIFKNTYMNSQKAKTGGSCKIFIQVHKELKKKPWKKTCGMKIFEIVSLKITQPNWNWCRETRDRPGGGIADRA